MSQAHMLIKDGANWRPATPEDFAGGGGSGGTANDRELVVTIFRVKTAFTGASVNDTVSCTRVLDVDGATATIVQTLWYNETTAATLSSAPSAADLDLTGTPSLTDAQLRASAVPVSSTPTNGTLVSKSGTITTGGTAQQLMAANSARRGFSVLNLSSIDLWINELGTAAAAQPSLKIVAGAYFETPAGYGSVGAVSIFGATTGAAFAAREW